MPPKRKSNKNARKQPVSQATNPTPDASPKPETPKHDSPEPKSPKKESTATEDPKTNIDEPETTKIDTSETNSSEEYSPTLEGSNKSEPKPDTHEPKPSKKQSAKSEASKENKSERNAPKEVSTKPDILKNDNPNPASPENLDANESGIAAEENSVKSQPVTESPEDAEKAVKEKELGNVAYKKKDFVTALKHYDKAFELDPKNIIPLTNKSAVYFEMGDYTKCLKACELAASTGRELNSDSKFIAKALGRMGSCYEKQSEFENAKMFYYKSLSEFRAPDIIKKAQALEKQMKEAERQACVDPALAEEEKLKGNKAFSDGNFPEALKFYTEAIRRNPDDARLYSNRATCYSKLMEFTCALKDCETCVELDPTFIEGYLQQATCYSAMKDINSARVLYSKALELDPNCQEAQDGLKRFDAAEAEKEADPEPGNESGVAE